MEGPGKGKVRSQGSFYSNQGRTTLHGPYHKANSDGLKLPVSWAARDPSPSGRTQMGPSTVLASSCRKLFTDPRFSQPAGEDAATLPEPSSPPPLCLRKGFRGSV